MANVLWRHKSFCALAKNAQKDASPSVCVKGFYQLHFLFRKISSWSRFTFFLSTQKCLLACFSLTLNGKIQYILYIGSPSPLTPSLWLFWKQRETSFLSGCFVARCFFFDCRGTVMVVLFCFFPFRKEGDKRPNKKRRTRNTFVVQSLVWHIQTSPDSVQNPFFFQTFSWFPHEQCVSLNTYSFLLISLFLFPQKTKERVTRNENAEWRKQ